MDDNKKIKLSDDALDDVAGGRTEIDFGSTAGQAEIVSTVLPPILLHPDARQEDEGMGTVPAIVGRL